MSAVLANPQVAELSHALREACLQVAVAQGPAALAREFARIAPELAFRQVLSRGGWYRLGGVIDAAGSSVADDLGRWAEDELAAHGDDMQAFADAHAERGLRATRLTGKTHYWVASTGPGTTDYFQVEIEELQEVIGHVLFDKDNLPGGIDELVDPGTTRARDESPLGIPFYSLRRIVHVADFLSRMRAQKPDPQPVHRFVTAWEGSSAGHAVQFANQWVLAVREHLDSHRQTIYHATPVAAVNGQAPKFESGFGVRGLALHDALTRFDRQAGYPLAWFFHMLTTKNVPHALAVAVVEDMDSGFGYLPQRDVQVLKDWLHRPFGF